MALIMVNRIIKSTELLPVGLLEIDMDVDANRVAIIDRESLNIMYAGGFSPSLKVVLPIDYATRDGLLVMIIDDDGQYNASVLDGVRTSVANLSEI